MRKYLHPVLLVVAVVFSILVCVASRDNEVKGDTPNAQPPKAGVVPFEADTARQLQDDWARYLSVEKTVKNSIGMELR